MKKTMIAKLIYRAKRGCVYDNDQPQYNCYSPVDYADGCQMGDCWVCDEYGNIHPGYSVSPVAISVESLGAIIGRMKVNYNEED